MFEEPRPNGPPWTAETGLSLAAKMLPSKPQPQGAPIATIHGDFRCEATGEATEVRKYIYITYITKKYDSMNLGIKPTNMVI